MVLRASVMVWMRWWRMRPTSSIPEVERMTMGPGRSLRALDSSTSRM